jgi:hypothetical protein
LHAAVQNGDISFQRTLEFNGHLQQKGKGQWTAGTPASCRDCILLTTLPLYFAAQDSPLTTERPKTIYFEIRVNAMGERRGEPEAGIALGFCAKPYPPWRLPGWQRASLGVHGDDGRRYVNDPDGGIDFTQPFRPGETVGIGITFSVPSSADDVAGAGPITRAQASVFFTRNGHRDGSAGWQMSEERDGQSAGVFGLEGEMDLYAAVGMFGAVDFEIFLAPEGWIYQP